MAVYDITGPTVRLGNQPPDDDPTPRPPRGIGRRGGQYSGPMPTPSPSEDTTPGVSVFDAMNSARRFAGWPFFSGAGFRDPYGHQRAAARAAAGRTPIATEAQFEQWVEGTHNRPIPYLGMGDETEFIYRSSVPDPAGVMGQATPARGGASVVDVTGAPARQTAHGRPVYRQGDEIRWVRDKGEPQIRSWQRFFSGLGFKTGPAGHWTEFEQDAMRAFMTMANMTPGGGMNVNTLRRNVMDQVRSGVYFYRGVNEEGDFLPQLLGEDVAAPEGQDGGGGGGLGTPQPTEPFTETVTERQTERFSVDEARAGVTRQLAQEIGRDPTEQELRSYVRDLNAALRADPTVITTVTTTDPVTGESTMDRTVDESDVDPEGMAMTFAEDVSPEERQEFQTGRYMDALMQAIGM